ncbi:hypothetical protein ACH4KN_14405 [Streptomyces sp. NPDC017546]|uniref:hypothetical protein n=1 Tax=unclassified Streptomyces TaxID=2593676 RepID=UPI0023610AD9|nr:hypothetical protein [Streptomyces sp. MMBL 11-1]
MRRGLPLCAVLVALALGAVGCSPTGGSAKPSDLIGAWSGPREARVTFDEDGSATAEKVPTHFSFEDGAPLDPVTGSGTWVLEKKANSVADQEVTLTIQLAPDSSTRLQLLIMDKGARGGIYLPVSADSPKRFIFKKVA